MNRILSGLIISAALIALGTGIVAFRRDPTTSSGLWDLAFMMSTVAFLGFFLRMLRFHAADMISRDEVGRRVWEDRTRTSNDEHDRRI